MNLRKPVLTILLFLLFTVAFAQQKDTILLIPGYSLLNCGKLKTGKSSYEFFLKKNGQQQAVGGLQEDLKKITYQGKSHYLRVCHITFGANTILDSGLAATYSLQPVFHRSLQPGKKMLFDFQGSLVLGSVDSRDSTGSHLLPVNHTSSHILFDSYFEDIIARSLPFKKGMVLRFPEYIYERGGQVWSIVEIKGLKKIEQSKNATIKCREIHFYEMDSKGNTTRETIYFIDENSRSILSREYIIGNTRILMVAA